ncbi:MAG: hypothetical protein EXR31_03765 [Betaproteobacteria bacterium]|nr:hypothetical protein [Betaproteobacteria bacterium]
MSDALDAKQPPAPKERAPQVMLAAGLVGAAWFIWLMVESGLDLNVRAKVGELVKLAEGPAAPTALALARSAHPLLAEFAIDPEGAVRLTLKGSPELEGRTLALVPQKVEGKVVGWRCQSDAPKKFLPRTCNLP